MRIKRGVEMPGVEPGSEAHKQEALHAKSLYKIRRSILRPTGTVQLSPVKSRPTPRRTAVGPVYLRMTPERRRINTSAPNGLAASN